MTGVLCQIPACAEARQRFCTQCLYADDTAWQQKMLCFPEPLDVVLCMCAEMPVRMPTCAAESQI